mmetsp:Transcript_32359/g.31662  ORF Transcript_32359/g.31662 Transcript_32359/m.31662 type:complete len:112 (-) Transcript_32359:45-380(-)
MVRVLFGSPDEEAKKEGMKKMFTEVIPKELAILEKVLSNNATQNYLVGDKMTIADFLFGSFMNSFFYNPANPGYEQIKDMLNNFPNVKKWAEHFNGEMAAYLAARPSPRPF